MKNRKTAKLITLVLSCILLIGAAMGITAFADEIVDETPEAPLTVSIDYKNVSYAGQMKLVYYAKASAELAEGQSVKVLYRDSAEAETVTLDSQASLTVEGEKYEAFFSAGFGPKDMRKTVYAQPVVMNADGTVAVYGDTFEYSLFDYAMAVFSKDALVDQRAILTKLLDYGASVQQVMFDEGLYPELPEVGYADEYYVYEYDVYVKTEIEVPVEGAVTPVTDTEGETPVTTTKEIWAPSGKTVKISLRAGQMKTYEFDNILKTEDGSYAFEGLGTVDADGNATFDEVYTVTNAAGIKLNVASANRSVELAPTKIGITKGQVFYTESTASVLDYETEGGIECGAPRGPENAKKTTGTFYYYNGKIVSYFYKNDAGEIGAYINPTTGAEYTGKVASVTSSYSFVPMSSMVAKELEYTYSGYYDYIVDPEDETNTVVVVTKHMVNSEGDVVRRTYPESTYSSQGYMCNIGAGADQIENLTLYLKNPVAAPEVVEKYVFETDFYYSGTYAWSIPSQFYVVNKNGTQIWGMNLVQSGGTLGATVYCESNLNTKPWDIYAADGTKLNKSSYTNSANYLIGGGRGNAMNSETWYNLRIEYEFLGDAAGTRRVSVYLDGVLSSYCLTDAATMPTDDSGFGGFKVFHLNGSRDTFAHFDNTYFDIIGGEAEEIEEEEELIVMNGTKYWYAAGATEPTYEATFTPDTADETKGTLTFKDNGGETAVTTTYTYVIGAGSTYTFSKEGTETTEIALTFDESGNAMLKVGDADAVKLGEKMVFGDDYPNYKGVTGTGKYAALADALNGSKPTTGSTIQSNIVTEGEGDAANNVLQVKMPDGKSAGGSATYSVKAETGAPIVFDFDFKLANSILDDADEGSQWSIKFALNSSAGEICLLTIYVVDEYYEIKYNGSQKIYLDMENEKSKFSKNEWYNFRMEYDYESGSTAAFKFYVNGKEANKIQTLNVTEKNDPANPTTFNFNIRAGGGTYTAAPIMGTEFYIDNVYVGEPIKDSLGEGEHVDAADKYITGEGESAVDGNLKVTDKAEKTAVKTSGDIYTYETDMNWTGKNGSFKVDLLAAQTEGAASVATLYGKVVNGVITLSTTEGGKAIATLLAGNWFNLRVEYTAAAKQVAGETEGETVTEYSGEYVIYINNNKAASVKSAAETTVKNDVYAGAVITVAGEGEVAGELTVDNTFCSAEYVDVIGEGENAKNSDKYVTGEGDAAVDGTLTVNGAHTFQPDAYLGQEYFFETDIKWLGESGSIVITDKDGATLMTITATVAEGMVTYAIAETEQVVATVPVGYWRNLSVTYAAGVVTVTVAGETATVNDVTVNSFGGATLNGNAEIDYTYCKSVYTDAKGSGANSGDAITNYTKDGVLTHNGAGEEYADRIYSWVTTSRKALSLGKLINSDLTVSFAQSGTGNVYVFETDLKWYAPDVDESLKDSDKAMGTEAGKVDTQAANAVYFTISIKSEAGTLFTVYAIGICEIDAKSGAQYVALSTSESLDDAFAYVRADLWYNVSVSYTVTETETEGAFAGAWTVALNGEQVGAGTVESTVDNSTYVAADVTLTEDVYDTALDLEKTYIGEQTATTEEEE